jgi:hypothetical protein
MNEVDTKLVADIMAEMARKVVQARGDVYVLELRLTVANNGNYPFNSLR